MLLRDALDLSKSIDHYRIDMYELAKKKGFTDPDVIKISDQLDRKIIMLQKMIYTIQPSRSETSCYPVYKHD